MKLVLAKEIDNTPTPDVTKEMTDIILAAKRMCDRLGDEGLIDPDRIRYSIMAREDRKAVAKDLAGKGMSTRQIAQVTGASQSTVARDVAEPNDSKSEPNGSARRAKKAPAPDEDMPTDEEADQSEQEALYDQACLILERMSGETRQRFFAHLKEVHHE